MATKVCVITGASKGIGLATALRFARAGWHVVAAARGAESLAAAEREIRAAGGECTVVETDVSQPADVRRLIQTAQETCGRIDVLVNNAGRAPLAAIDEMDPEEYTLLNRVNLDAIFHATQAVWPIMKQQGGGVIVNISSLAAQDPFRGFAAYGASKAWVNVFSQATAQEGKPFGIRVYAIAPGAVETKLMRAAFPDLPAEHVLEPERVASAIECVCDERMSAATGETICVRK